MLAGTINCKLGLDSLSVNEKLKTVNERLKTVNGRLLILPEKKEETENGF